MNISAGLYRSLIDQCRAVLPHEACGLLTADGQKITGIYPVTNRSPVPHSFRMDADEFEDIYRKLVTQSANRIGVYHSHPHDYAVVSPADADNFHRGTFAFMLIVSLLRPAQEQVGLFYFSHGSWVSDRLAGAE